MKCLANGSNPAKPVQCETKHHLHRTLLFLITPSKQHLGTKERASLPPLHTAAAEDSGRSSDAIASSPPGTSHALDGALFTSSFFFLALIFQRYDVLHNILA